MFGSGNEVRLGRIAYHLLKKVEPAQRAALMMRVLDQAKALRCSQYLVVSLAQEAEKAAKGDGDSLVPAAEVQALKAAWCVRVKQLAADADFIDHASVAWLVSAWREWGDAAEAVAWWQAAAANDTGLLKLIAAQASESRTQSGSDLAWRPHLRVDPRGLEPYGDVQALAERVRALLDRGAVAEPHLAAAKQFVLACERMRAGKTPDAFGSSTTRIERAAKPRPTEQPGTSRGVRRGRDTSGAAADADLVVADVADSDAFMLNVTTRVWNDLAPQATSWFGRKFFSMTPEQLAKAHDASFGRWRRGGSS